MGMTTSVRIDDHADDVQKVFEAAMWAIGLDPVVHRGERCDYTDEASTIWQIHRGGDVQVEGVSLHFRADGQRLDEDYLCGEAYLLVELDTGDLGDGNTVEQHRARHRELVEQFGAWLTGQDLTWRYRHEFEAPAWTLGHDAAAGAA